MVVNITIKVPVGSMTELTSLRNDSVADKTLNFPYVEVTSSLFRQRSRVEAE